MTSYKNPIPRHVDDPLVKDMTCTICQELPLEPVITSCDHIFCNVCIEQSLEESPVCPNDRTPLTKEEIKSLSGMLRRVWTRIEVKCPHHGCTWSETLGNYEAHAERCSCSSMPPISTKQEIANLNDQIRELEAENSMLTATLEDIDSKCHTLEQKILALHRLGDAAEEGRVYKLQREKTEAETKIKELNKRLKQANRVKLDRSYSYGRHKVVELTQLICCHLLNPPREVNTNRIYNCVRWYYQSIERPKAESSDPDEYETNVHMLLWVCLASKSWFTINQNKSFERWCKDQRWKDDV